MRLVRFRQHERVAAGRLEGDEIIVLEHDIFHPDEETGERVALRSVQLLSPVEPSKVIGVGWNYVGHANELGQLQPTDPLIFLKAPSAIVGPDQPVMRPAFSQRLSYEGELVAVIGRDCRDLTPENALDAVFGWTCGNDITDRDIQKAEVQYARSKSFDTFCPLGPWVETDFDYTTALIETSVNGQVVQSGSTDLMIHKVPDILAWCSRSLTLRAGDVIMTGTPKGVGLLEPGDDVEVHIPGIGRLSNAIVAEPSRAQATAV
jgi:2-keto-4-pentenoate hydratase/2-oxohepta-3-ene-1,7-dioic acid hydratase in catechol pathway